MDEELPRRGRCPGQFAATVTDYARLGNLVKNQGRANGKEIVPASWILKMVDLRRDKPQPNRPPFLAYMSGYHKLLAEDRCSGEWMARTSLSTH